MQTVDLPGQIRRQSLGAQQGAVAVGWQGKVTDLQCTNLQLTGGLAAGHPGQPRRATAGGISGLQAAPGNPVDLQRSLPRIGLQSLDPEIPQPHHQVVAVALSYLQPRQVELQVVDGGKGLMVVHAQQQVSLRAKRRTVDPNGQGARKVGCAPLYIHAFERQLAVQDRSGQMQHAVQPGMLLMVTHQIDLQRNGAGLWPAQRAQPHASPGECHMHRGTGGGIVPGAPPIGKVQAVNAHTRQPCRRCMPLVGTLGRTGRLDLLQQVHPVQASVSGPAGAGLEALHGELSQMQAAGIEVEFGDGNVQALQGQQGGGRTGVFADIQLAQVKPTVQHQLGQSAGTGAHVYIHARIEPAVAQMDAAGDRHQVDVVRQAQVRHFKMRGQCLVATPGRGTGVQHQQAIIQPSVELGFDGTGGVLWSGGKPGQGHFQSGQRMPSTGPVVVPAQGTTMQLQVFQHQRRRSAGTGFFEEPVEQVLHAERSIPATREANGWLLQDQVTDMRIAVPQTVRRQLYLQGRQLGERWAGKPGRFANLQPLQPDLQVPGVDRHGLQRDGTADHLGNQMRPRAARQGRDAREQHGQGGHQRQQQDQAEQQATQHQAAQGRPGSRSRGGGWLGNGRHARHQYQKACRTWRGPTNACDIVAQTGGSTPLQEG